MKTFLMIIAFVLIFATLTEAKYYDKSEPVTCNNYKGGPARPDDMPCSGCVFELGDMKGKCKEAGNFFVQSICAETEGGVWCKLTFTC